MRNSLTVFVFLSLAGTMPAAAKTACPTRASGPFPWVIAQPMDGDRYADIYLDINERGRATECRVGANNIAGDDKFWICRAFVEQWNTKPKGIAGEVRHTTVKRQWIADGPKHLEAQKAARRHYFLDHPSEPPECFREDTPLPGLTNLSV